MDRIIEVKVFGSHLSKDSNFAGVRGEGNVTSLRITFDESWDKLTKRVVFWDAFGENAVKILLTDEKKEKGSERVYTVPIPSEPMNRAGKMTFSIEGFDSDEGKKQKSITACLEVKDAPDIFDPVTPTPTETELMNEFLATVPIRNRKGEGGIIVGDPDSARAKGELGVSIGFKGAGNSVPKIKKGNIDILPTSDEAKNDIKSFFKNNSNEYPLSSTEYYRIHYGEDDLYAVYEDANGHLVIDDDVYRNTADGMVSMSVGSGNTANAIASYNFGSMNKTGMPKKKLTTNSNSEYISGPSWGAYSANFGWGNWTMGAQAFTAGGDNLNNGHRGVSLGSGNKTFSFGTLAMGVDNVAGDSTEKSYGHNDADTHGSGRGAVAIGVENKSTHTNSALLGSHLTSGKNNQVIIGNSNEVNEDADIIIASNNTNLMTYESAFTSFEPKADANYHCHSAINPVILFPAGTFSADFTAGETVEVTMTLKNGNIVYENVEALCDWIWTKDNDSFEGNDAMRVITSTMKYDGPQGELTEEIIKEIFGIGTQGTQSLQNKTTKKIGNTCTNVRVVSGKEFIFKAPICGVDPTNNAHLTTKGYVDKVTTSIPTKVSQLTNDAGYVKSENDGDVCILSTNGAIELRTLVSNYPAYLKVDKRLRASIYGYDGVSIDSENTGGVEIKNIKTPKNDLDAANKAYVDSSLPTKVSQLENDADYATRSQIPKNLTQLENDADFATRDEIPKNLTQLENDADFATRDEIPAKVSDLPNDAGYITNENLTESNRASQIVKQSHEATVIKLDDSAELPFDKIDAPDGSTVAVYGKNLVPCTWKDGVSGSYPGFITESLPAGVYTISFTQKEYLGSDIPKFVYASAKYDSGNSFGDSILLSGETVLKKVVTITLAESGKICIYASGISEAYRRENISRIATIQIEAGTVATEYEEYKELQTVIAPIVEMPTTHYPNTTVVCNKGCSVKYKADATIAYKRTVPIEAAIVFETPKSKVIKLNDDVVQAPFVDIDAPDGSTVNIYGKNLVKNEIYEAVLSNGNSSFGYRTQSLPAGDYTISLSFKDDNDFPKYIYATGVYDDGTSFGNALYMTTEMINSNPLKITLSTSGYIRVFDAANRNETVAKGELSKITSIQIEAGSDATEYEEYKKVQTVTMPVDEMPTTHYPNTTVVCNKNCSVKYVANGSKAYNKLLDRITALESAAVNNI